MKKSFKGIVAIFLCFMLILPISTTAFAKDGYVIEESEGTKNVSPIVKFFNNLVDDIIDKLVGIINTFVPDPKWDKEEDYQSKGLLKGTEIFLDEPSENAVWSVGYSSASLIENPDEVVGKYFVGGSLAVSDKLATELVDDLRVRTIAMSDGSGRGIVVFSVIDGYGMASTDVRAIREQMADYLAEKNIVSLNISVLHQHSAIDCFGMNGSIGKALLNPFRNIIGSAPVNGKDADYMKHLYNTVENTTKQAVEKMTEGKMYFSKVDVNDYVKDKRPPFVLDTNFDIFRFVPNDNSREVWFTTSPIHCVGNGAGGTAITADYPYYMEKEINERANADFMMVLTAEQGTSQRREVIDDKVDENVPYSSIMLYGKFLGDLVYDAMMAKQNVEIAPLLNVRCQEVKYTIDNQILVFAGKMGLVANKVVKTGANKYSVVSEIGYMEMGNDLAVAFVPGELAAELAYGGCLTKETSWKGEDWTRPSMQEITGDRELVIFGIMNDQVGYIIPGNDFMSVIYEDNKSLELVSLGDKAADQTIDAYISLVNSVR